MLRSRWLTSCLLVCAATGCQAYGPYGYNSPYGYSAPYGGPGYSAPGTMQPYYGAPGTHTHAPGTLAPAPGFGPQGQNFGPMTGYGPANTYNYNGNVPPVGADTTGTFGNPAPFPGTGGQRPTMPGDEKLVPNYGDPTLPNSSRSPVKTPDISDPAAFKDALNGPQKAADALKGMDDDQALLNSASRTSKSNPFETAVETTGFQTASADATSQIQVVSGRPFPNPYAQARDGRSWFRGVIDFDEQDQTWYVIYNPEAGAEDPRGGLLILVDDPRLKNFEPDDIVLVEGVFDPLQTDRVGQPKYRLSNVQRMIPKEI